MHGSDLITYLLTIASIVGKETVGVIDGENMTERLGSWESELLRESTLTQEPSDIAYLVESGDVTTISWRKLTVVQRLAFTRYLARISNAMPRRSRCYRVVSRYSVIGQLPRTAR